MAVDGKHSVVTAQPSVLRSQPPLQQVKDENAWLVRPPYELDAQLLPRVPLVKDHVEDLFPGTSAVHVAVSPVPKAPLAQHGEVQRATGLGEDCPGVVVGHIADIAVVDLEERVVTTV